MHLTPREQERLLIYVAADVARKRRERGLLLNYPEAIAILYRGHSRMGPRRKNCGGDHDARSHGSSPRPMSCPASPR